MRGGAGRARRRRPRPGCGPRLLAQRSHLAFYDGEQERVEELSAAALAQARAAGDDDALVSALRARQEARPGPSGREERLALGAEMVALAARLDSPRTAMWGRLWRVEAMIEAGRLAEAADELGALGVAVERVGGPVSAWHRDRVTACIAQAQGRYAEAAEVGRRGFVRMRAIERAPATGAYFALQTALAGHVGVSVEAEAFLGTFESPPRFRTIQKLSQAVLLLAAGRAAEADASYRQAGPLGTWSLPAFFVLPGYVYATIVTAQLGRVADLAALLDRLAPHRDEHAIGGGVAYLGPVALALGRGAVALGRLDEAVEHLSTAVALATAIGAPGYVAEADYHLATALLRPRRPGRARARAPRSARASSRRSAWPPTPSGPRSSGAAGRRPGAQPAGGGGGGAGRRGPHQPADRPAAGDLRAHGAEPRAAHPDEAGVRHARADRCVAGEYPMSISADGLVSGRFLTLSVRPTRATTTGGHHDLDRHRHPALHRHRDVRRRVPPRSAQPDGLEARWVGHVGDELRVIMVWSSREQAERFFTDVLRPAVAAKVGPDRKPGLVGFAAEREYRRELVSP